MGNKFAQIKAQALDELNAQFLHCPEDWNTLVQKRIFDLAVQEAVNVCLAQRDPQNLNYRPSEKFADAIKQHFGVY